jgi:hypothetical protein
MKRRRTGVGRGERDDNGRAAVRTRDLFACSGIQRGRVAYCGNYSTVCVRDATFGVAAGEPLQRHNGYMFSVAVIADGALIVSGGSDI